MPLPSAALESFHVSMQPVVASLFSLIIFNLWVIFAGKYILSLTKRGDNRLNHFQAYSLSMSVILIILLNLNQVIGSNLVFISFYSLTLVFFMYVTYDIFFKDDNVAFFKHYFSLLSVQLIMICFIYWLFKLNKYWLFEGVNHDSLVYFEGLMWSLDNPLQVSKELVKARWSLGGCGDGGSLYIGYDCTLYRGGTYTLAAWTQFFSPTKTGNGLWLTGIYSTLFLWLSTGILTTKKEGNCQENSSHIKLLAYSLIISFSTSWVGTLANANLATCLAASNLALIFSLSFVEDFKFKPVLLGMLIGSVSHIYSEGIYYAGFISIFILLKDHPRIFGKRFILNSLITLLVLIVSSNFTLFAAVKSLISISAQAQSSQWASWYMHQEPWKWIGSFIAGEVVGSDEISKDNVVIASVVLACAASYLLMKAKKIKSFYIIFFLSAILIFIVISRNYEYGEHKILQLLGPCWVLLIIASLIHCNDKVIFIQKARRGVVVLIVLLICYIQADYIFRVYELFQQPGKAHIIPFGSEGITSSVLKGSTVAIDDASFTHGTEQFFGGHYAIFFTHYGGSIAVMPNISDNELRGGYYRSMVKELKDRHKINYVLQVKGVVLEKSIIKYDGLLKSTPKYDLFYVGLPYPGTVLLGNGWYTCEKIGCWTKENFEIEVFSNKKTSLEVKLDYFFPPKNGVIHISSNGKIIKIDNVKSETLVIPVVVGYSKFIFSPNWPVTSPLIKTLSTDNRLLFALVRQVQLLKRIK